ncbi:MAG: dTMP kinase [Bacteroidota bacterium]
MAPPDNSPKFLSVGQPYLDLSDLKGKLIVIEGTDGVGRSSQITELNRWLEVQGYGVITTGWTRSPLIGKTINEAKSGHTLNENTYSLLYAADFADRLEHEIIPALKAGFIVLADRYVYTLFARSEVRGTDPEWLRAIFGFALVPDAIFYMRISINELIPRVINSETLEKRYWDEQSGEGIDYWESGMDMRLGKDFYDSFVRYQRRVLREFERMAKEFNFTIVDASDTFEGTNLTLKNHIKKLLDPPDSAL